MQKNYSRIHSANRIALVLLSASIAQFAFSGPASAEGVRAKVEKWAEASQVASKEAADWRVEKETLRATRDLLKQERDALKQQLEELANSGAGASEERQGLLERSADYEEKAAVLGDKITLMEAQVKALAPRLPAPLVEKIEPLLIQIPEDPANTRVSQSSRLMNVLGVLIQAEKFNSTANFVGETRSIDGSDRKVSVRTLYWGLSQAIYVDAEGKVAGFGRPTDEGWRFEVDPEVTAQAAHLLDIYEGNTDDIEFINFPVELR